MSHLNPPEQIVGALGPVVLERLFGQPHAVARVGVGVVGLISAVWLIVLGLGPANGGLACVAAGAFMGLLGFLILAISFQTYWANRGGRQFVHEYGMREESPRGVTCIAFDQADELEYMVTDHYNNGVFAGSVDHFGLRTTGARSKEIVFSRLRRKRTEPTPFPPIVEEISTRLAEQLSEAIQRGESVRWTSKMTINRDGLILAPRSWSERPGLAKFRREEPSRLSWDDIDKIEVDKGFCQLRLKGSSKPRLKVEVGEPNFHPGYRAVAEIIHTRAASRPMEPVRALAHGEKIVVEYPYSIEVRFGLERANFLVNEKARKSAREIRLGFAVVLPACGAGLAVMSYFERKMGIAALRLRLALCSLFGVAAYLVIEVGERLLTRRKVYREARLAEERFNSGKGPDPAYLYQVTLGPAGFSLPDARGRLRACLERSLTRALGPRLDHHLPGRNRHSARRDRRLPPRPRLRRLTPRRDAFERCTDWYQAARNQTPAS